MRNYKKIFFIFLFAFIFVGLPLKLTGETTFAQPYAYAEEVASESETLQLFLAKCDDILAIDNYLSNGADSCMSEYLSSKRNLTDEDNLTIEGNEAYKGKLQNADEKYRLLSIQKGYVQDYSVSEEKLAKVINVDHSNKESVRKIVQEYKEKREILRQNGLEDAINSSSDTHLATVENALNSLKIQIDRPVQNRKFGGVFTYDGKEHKVTEPDEQLGYIAIYGFDEETMEFDGVYTDFGRKEVGNYAVKIKPKENYEWSTGENKDEILTFAFEIVKANYKYVEYVTLNSLSLTYNGQGCNLDLILKDTEEAKKALVQNGLNYDDVKDNVAGLFKAQGLNVRFKYNGVEKSSVVEVGTYAVVAEFYDKDGFKNYNEIEPLSSTLVINATSISYVDNNLIEKAELTVDETGFISPNAVLQVKEILTDEFPLDQNSAKFRKYVAENEQIVFSYDIKIAGAEGTLLVGKSTLKVLIPEVVKGKQFKILHVHGNETYYEVEVVDYIIDGDYAIFNLVDFSTFSFVCEKDATLAWWVILLICFAGLVVLLTTIYLLMFFAWKKKGDTKVKALVPYFKRTHKTIYKIEYKEKQELTSNGVKLLEMSQDNSESEQEPATLNETKEEVVAETRLEQKQVKEKAKKSKIKSTAPRKVGRPRKEKVAKEPKKCGRPRKEHVPMPPKKRGRPRKEKVVEKVAKKRGRPRKTEK